MRRERKHFPRNMKLLPFHTKFYKSKSEAHGKKKEEEKKGSNGECDFSIISLQNKQGGFN